MTRPFDLCTDRSFIISSFWRFHHNPANILIVVETETSKENFSEMHKINIITWIPQSAVSENAIYFKFSGEKTFIDHKITIYIMTFELPFYQSFLAEKTINPT